ncbi:unnamed protein product [Boreogadus saida]
MQTSDSHGGQVFTALIGCVVKSSGTEFNQTVQQKLKSTENQADDLIKELEQEIERSDQYKLRCKRSHTLKTHLHFLQAFRFLKDPPPTRNWTTVESSDLRHTCFQLILSEDGKQVLMEV